MATWRRSAPPSWARRPPWSSATSPVALPQLRLHPGEDGAAHGGGLQRRKRQRHRLGIKANGLSIDWNAVQIRRAKVSKTLKDGVRCSGRRTRSISSPARHRSRGAARSRSAPTAMRRRRSCWQQARWRWQSRGRVLRPVIDTWGAWSLEKLPKALVVAGAGASGSEIASAYARLGVEVTLVEMLDRVLPLEDKDMGRGVERQFKKDGSNAARHEGRGGDRAEDRGEGEGGDKELKPDDLVIAGGRASGHRESSDWTPQASRPRRTARSRPTRTNELPADGIHAIGDLVRGPGLVDKALRGGRGRGRDPQPAISLPTPSTWTFVPGPIFRRPPGRRASA